MAAPDFKYIIRPGRNEDRPAYLRACQRSAELAYRRQDPASPNLFSETHYFHPSLAPYWNNMVSNDGGHRWWVAELLVPSKEIVGGICLQYLDGRFQGSGFYVVPEWQQKGIGKSLWAERSKVSRGPIHFEVYSHAKKTITYHERHGAKRTGRQRSIHWESWPPDANLTALEFVSG